MDPCPTLYHPKMNPICGGVDGEATERWWSSLGKFDLITREMLNSNRHEQLEDVNLYLRNQKMERLYKSLKLSLSKAKDNLSSLTLLLRNHDEKSLNDFWINERNEMLHSAVDDVNRVGKKAVSVLIENNELGKLI